MLNFFTATCNLSLDQRKNHCWWADGLMGWWADGKILLFFTYLVYFIIIFFKSTKTIIELKHKYLLSYRKSKK